MNYNFQDDIKDGESNEVWLANKICKRWNGKLVDGYNKNYKYDFIIKFPNNKQFKFEAKIDYMGWTENFALEYESWNKLSGINTTQSDYYLYRFHWKDRQDWIWAIKTSDLRDMVEKKSYIRSVIGGDVGSNTKLHLFTQKYMLSSGKVTVLEL